MRLRACLALLCLMLAGCQHLPDGVVIDLENRAVSVGPCRCALPDAVEREPEPSTEAELAPENLTADAPQR